MDDMDSRGKTFSIDYILSSSMAGRDLEWSTSQQQAVQSAISPLEMANTSLQTMQAQVNHLSRTNITSSIMQPSSETSLQPNPQPNLCLQQPQASPNNQNLLYLMAYMFLQQQNQQLHHLQQHQQFHHPSAHHNQRLQISTQRSSPQSNHQPTFLLEQAQQQGAASISNHASHMKLQNEIYSATTAASISDNLSGAENSKPKLEQQLPAQLNLNCWQSNSNIQMGDIHNSDSELSSAPSSPSTINPTGITTNSTNLDRGNKLKNINDNVASRDQQLPTGSHDGHQMAMSFLPGTSAFPWTIASRGKPRRGMMRRAVFSDSQRVGLEKRFQLQKYISKPDRKKLAEKLGLRDSQVKIWFQNRRMKWRNSKERELLSAGGSREQTLPTRNNPNPDLSDVGETIKRIAGSSINPGVASISMPKTIVDDSNNK